MSDVNSTPAPPEPGVMGSLPKTRPQRPSARRSAARGRAAAKAGAVPARPIPAKAAAKTVVKPRRAKPAKVAVKEAQPPLAPKQGFEAENEVELGKAVHPPGGAELAASVVELFGELAQTGLSGGGKLLKDTLSRLSGS